MFRNLLTAVSLCVLCACLLPVAVGDDVAKQAEVLTCTETDGPTNALGLFKPGRPLTLEEGFENPPAISRVKCWWQCHGSAFTKAEITRQLEEFKDKGWGGVELKDTVTMPREAKTAHIKDIPYLSEEWLEMFAHINAECERLGLICSSRFGSGWNTGGPWVKPEGSSQALKFLTSSSLVGPQVFDAEIPRAKNKPTQEDFEQGNAYVLAIKQGTIKSIDLTKKVDSNHHLRWEVPEGNWTIITCYQVPTGKRMMSTSPTGGGLHCDHLAPEGIDLQFEMISEKMEKKIGPFKNNAFDGFNCDSWELGVPTWTTGFRDSFIKRNGYDPIPYLPLLTAPVGGTPSRKMGFHPTHKLPLWKDSDLGNEARRFMYDYRNTVSDLIVENFYRRGAEYCKARNIGFSAQPIGPSHVSPVSVFDALGSVTIPMGEFWAYHKNKSRAKGRACVKVQSSVAHSYGKRIVALESWTDTRQDGKSSFSRSPAQLKYRADEAFLLGGNSLCASVVEYTPLVAGKPGWVHGAGPHLNSSQSWWPLSRPVFDYFARCSFMLQAGESVSQVAVYRTFQDGSREYLWNSPADDLIDSYSNQFAFDYVGDDLIQNHMESKDGQLVLKSGATYQLLYIYPTKRGTMPLETLKKIKTLLDAGTKVVWAGLIHEKSPGLKNYPACDNDWATTVEAISKHKNFRNIAKHSYDSLMPLLEKSVSPPAWKFEDKKPIRLVHRKQGNKDWFFIVNCSDEKLDTAVLFNIKGRAPKYWRPESGEISRAAFTSTSQGVRLPLTMAARESLFVVFDSEEDSLEVLQLANSDVLPLNGPWKLTPTSGKSTVVMLDELKSWPELDDPTIRHYSGVAEYQTTFNCQTSFLEAGQNMVLDLGEVAEVAQVWLNGKLVGTSWCSPHEMDITGFLLTGENELEIKVANLWHNRILADSKLPKEKRVTQIVPEARYKTVAAYEKRQGFLKSGLLGPVQVILKSSE